MTTRPVLYLLPGLLCDAYTFEKQRVALSDEFDVRVLDFFGLDSMTAMAEKVLAHAPAKFSACGFSMGGRALLRIMALAPERVERVCLLDTAVTPAAPGEAEKRQTLVDLAHAKGMKALCDVWLPPMLNEKHRADPAIVGPLTEMVCRATPEIFEGQIRALLGRPDARPLLAGFKCPTLVAVGRQDEWSDVPSHETFARMIPGAKLEIIEDSGHFTPVEQPDVLTDALRRWMHW
jgi:pimeloyl-ACP methyl ester carboxylesterase